MGEKLNIMQWLKTCITFLLSEGFRVNVLYAVVGAYLGLKAIPHVLHFSRNRGWFAMGEKHIDYQENRVYLHMFPRSSAKQMLNLSPFAVKVESFLRLHRIPYEVR